MSSKKNILVIVPGWPSNYRPNFMAFFYKQVLNLAKRSHHRFDVFVPLSIWSFLKIENFKKKLAKGIIELHKPPAQNVRLVPLIYSPFPKKFQYKLSNNILADRILNIVNKNDKKYDLIHAHFFDCARVSFKLKEQLNIPFVYTEHSSDYTKYLNDFDDSEIKKVTHNAKSVIAVSPFLATEIVNFNSLDSDSVQIIPNGIDTDKFSLKKTRHDDLTRFLFIGHLIDRKGIRELLQAFNVALDENSHIELSVIGKGPLEEWCRKFIESNSLEEKIKLLGVFKNDDLPNIIKQHDVLVQPSKNESFGVVVIEAASCGLPCIVTRCGGPEFIIDTKNLGKVLDLPISIRKLSSTILDIRNNLTLYSKSKIREAMIQRFSWNTISNKILDTYQ